jgi:AcrR family transcriptional regulator
MRVERQLTIDEIAERLALSRTTVYHWLTDLPLENRGGRPAPTAHRERVAKLNSARYARLRKEAYAKGAAMFDELSREPTFEHFVCMFIAEGHKRNRNAVAICNSDPAIVALADRWLRRLSHKEPKYSIQYHADQDLEELCAFWAGLLGIKPGAISLQRKSNSNQLTGRTWRSKHGVLNVRVDDTYLRERMQAWVDRLRAAWA